MLQGYAHAYNACACKYNTQIIYMKYHKNSKILVLQISLVIFVEETVYMLEQIYIQA